jgi:hypothetical protein
MFRVVRSLSYSFFKWVKKKKKKKKITSESVLPVIDISEHPLMMDDVLSCLIIRHAER